MKTAKELYPNSLQKFIDEEECFQAPYDYQPILDQLGEIILQVDDDDSEGDSRVLYRSEEGKYGYLIFGWGSCSGCDALQGCDSFKEVDELIESLKDQVKWFDSKSDMLSYFKTKDWQLEYMCHQREGEKFINQTIEYLSK